MSLLKLERSGGIEPPSEGWKPSVIPLYELRIKMLARLTGIEPVTYSLEGCCSILLSYRRTDITQCRQPLQIENLQQVEQTALLDHAIVQ